MKKLTLLLLVAMIPFLTMAQKRSKRGSKKVETVDVNKASYEFMIITGYEVIIPPIEKKQLQNDLTAIPPPDVKLQRLIKSNIKAKIAVNFDGGKLLKEELAPLNEQSRNFRTMAGAVNAVANLGWEFYNSDVVVVPGAKIHYYYMKRNK